MQKWIDIRTGTEGGMEDLVFKEIIWKFHPIDSEFTPKTV